MQGIRTDQRKEQRQEFARIDADLLEDLLNAAGEISIYHSRLSQQVSSFEFHVEELGTDDQSACVSSYANSRSRLKRRSCTAIRTRWSPGISIHWSSIAIRTFSNCRARSRNRPAIWAVLKDLLQSLTTEAEGLLVQQSRVTAELQDGLMRTRMVPFERHVPRLTRLVRQIAKEAGTSELSWRSKVRRANWIARCSTRCCRRSSTCCEMRSCTASKSPTSARPANKPAQPVASRFDLHREGRGDGHRRRGRWQRGWMSMQFGAKRYELDLLKPKSKVTDEEIMELILTPGFSTASKVTQSAGRGVGMDVVANEVKKLGGSLRISSVTGQGTNFTVRLPFTLAITQALIVRTGDEVYALPLPSVEGVARIPRGELENLLSQSEPSYRIRRTDLQVPSPRHVSWRAGRASCLRMSPSCRSSWFVRANNLGRVADRRNDRESRDRRQVRRPAAGEHSWHIGRDDPRRWSNRIDSRYRCAGRTGAPVVELKKARHRRPADDRPLAMVVDDSITVRRVTERVPAAKRICVS